MGSRMKRKCPNETCLATFVKLEELFGADRTLPVLVDCPQCGTEIEIRMQIVVRRYVARARKLEVTREVGRVKINSFIHERS